MDPSTPEESSAQAATNLYQAAIEAAVTDLTIARDCAKALGWVATTRSLRAMLQELARTDAGTQERRPREAGDAT